jgi:DNA polymerase I-like protein with 3'-5' exonuclease and polymerase domains
MNFVAIDTETEQIKQRKTLQLKQRKVKLEPYEPPELVLMSTCTKGGPELHTPDEVEGVLCRIMERGDHIVFHNAAFDFWVLARHCPQLVCELIQYAADDKIHDTMLMDMLVNLAQGHYDRPSYPDFKLEQMQPRSLVELARERVGMQLNKDETIRISFGHYKGHLDEMPDSYKDYAEQDVLATYRVWEMLLAHVPGNFISGQWCPNRKLLSEPIQTRASIALATLDVHGVKIDKEEAKRLRAIFEKDVPGLQEELAEGGLAEWCPMGGIRRKKQPYMATGGYRKADIERQAKLGWTPCVDGAYSRVKPWKSHYTLEHVDDMKFHLLSNQVRACLMERVVPHMNKEPKRTPTGLLSLKADDWSGHIPEDDAPLQSWRKLMKLQKILDTYLYLYSQVDEVYPNWVCLGPRSGRMACRAPNNQNLPKRKYGIRSLIVPHEGNVFVQADYTTQELFTLADTMKHQGIDGPLLRAIKDGVDLHRFTASLLTGKPMPDITKDDRQAAKVLNFGIPGGLGPAKIAFTAKKDYGLAWSVHEAREAKRKYLRKFWDIAEYLKRLQTSLNANLIRVSQRGCAYWANEIGLSNGYTVLGLKKAMQDHPNRAIRRLISDAERNNTVVLPSGRQRAGCLFTEAANTGFQGPASDVTKQATFRAVKAGLMVVLVAHDELVIECEPGEVDQTKFDLERAMVEAFKDVCRYVGEYAKVEVTGPLHRWGPAKDKDGRTI